MASAGRWFGEWMGRWFGASEPSEPSNELAASLSGSGSISATLTFTTATVEDDYRPIGAPDATSDRGLTIDEQEMFDAAMALIMSGALETST